MSALKRQPRKFSRGFTLLEALIAMLVLSIGLLGLAGLQATSARFGHDAYVRSLTTMIASEIIDKIRMRTGKQNDQAGRLNAISSFATTAPAGTCNPNLGTVANDLACWQNNISNLLPGGSGSITDNADGSFTVTVSWYDRDGETTRSTNWTFVTSGS